jgi:hypothetical protein
MARNPPTYSELNNAPALCKDKAAPYIRVDPAQVRAPYKGVDVVVVPVEGIINTDDTTTIFEMFLPLEESLDDQGVGTLGWQSDEELDLIIDMINEANEVVAEAQAMTIEGAGGIVNMAAKAVYYLEMIADTYQSFQEDVVYKIEQGGTELYVSFPLNHSEDSFHPVIDFGSDATWQGPRIQARVNIVKWWDHALSLLWCSEIGIAQVESFLGNKAEVGSGGFKVPGEVEPTTPGGGFSLASGDPDPGPGPGEKAPTFPDPGPTDPEEPEEPEEPETDPRPGGDGTGNAAPVSTSSGGGAGLLIGGVVVAFLLLRK